MIIDKKGKLFGKVSIVDVCVILVVIIGVLGAYVASSVIRNNNDENRGLKENFDSLPTVSAKITLDVNGVRHMTKDALCVGEEVHDTVSDTLIGTISKVTSKPAVKMCIANDGSYYEATVPEKYDVEISVDVLGKQTEAGFMTLEELLVLYGSEIEIKTSSIKTSSEVSDIEVMTTGE